MHPVLVNLFRRAVDAIDDDPEQFLADAEKFVKMTRVAARRFKKKIKSKSFERQLRSNLLRVAARKVRRAL
jgi:hypothetical protein